MKISDMAVAILMAVPLSLWAQGPRPNRGGSTKANELNRQKPKLARPIPENPLYKKRLKALGMLPMPNARSRVQAMIAVNRKEARAISVEINKTALMISEPKGLPGEYDIVITDHFLLGGQVGEAELARRAILAEMAYWDLGQLFYRGPGEDLYKKRKLRHLIFFTSNASDFFDIFDYVMARWAQKLLKSKSFAMSSGFICSYQQQHPITCLRDGNHAESWLANEVTCAWIVAHATPVGAPYNPLCMMDAWYSEGLGTWFSILYTGNEYTKKTYRSSDLPLSDKDKESRNERWTAWPRAWANNGCITSPESSDWVYTGQLENIHNKKLNRFNRVDRTINYAFFDYLIRNRRAELQQFYRLVRRLPAKKAFTQAVGDTFPAFEKKFKAWLRSN